MSSGTEGGRRTPTSSTGAGTPPPVDDTPLAVFFAQFASFSFNANQSSNKNFDRLVRVIRCGPQDPERREVREGFKDALVQEFNARFGIDGNDISNWQNLCRVLRIDPVPDSIEECRLRVWDTHVNLVDLVDSARTGKPVKLFASLGELTAYTLQKPKKFFPKENAYQGGLLKELLREIINPYFGKRRNGSAKRKERKRKQKAARAAAGSD
ncbi:hypothetical protein DFJ58DRAFT_917919 [Suillus subalutaceus]|uniref:uncharacterized protein n=1 Tax=Suillus subalutaceus TaxID=48586 RepID=UPI001B878350|nr:uncharacterized protein DFJ58DRAFT_917919 [Suillus subalutaceus]KAG1835359.1 hypothetical protein DFJ58DRAFT_917919 [Suillus subalutaceus]